MKTKRQKTQKSVSKKQLKIEDYKNCLQEAQIEKKPIQKKINLMQIVLKNS